MKKINIVRELLHKLYIVDELSTVEIGKILHVGFSLIHRRLKEYNIPIRSFSESQKTTSVKNKIKKTCLEKYGVESYLQSNDKIEKSKKTCLEKYGVENHTQSSEVKSKIKKTSLERYGVSSILKDKGRMELGMINKYGIKNIFQDVNYIQQQFNNKYGVNNPMLLDKFKEKLKNTLVKKYGVEHSSQIDGFMDKVRHTSMKKFGEEHYSKTKECKERNIKTLIKNFGKNYKTVLRKKRVKTYKNKTGYEYPLQNPECQQKTFINGLKKKIYMFPSGRKELVQGYEPFILDHLIKNEKICENDIVVGITNVPQIKFIDNMKKFRTHFPDIYIKSKNLLIEVKNLYHLKKFKEFFLYRKSCAIQQGFNYKLLCYDKKEGITEIL